MLTLLYIVAALLIVGGFGVLLYPWLNWVTTERYDRPDKPPNPKWELAALLIVVGVFTTVGLSGAAQVPATHFAVVENTWTGSFYQLGPGTHIWPFQPILTPMVTIVTKYDLRRQIIEIGGQPVREIGVQADSNSPGRPVVYFFGRGWAYPNRNKIIELHRRYGPKYLDDWVERVWVASLKGIQGERPYDFVGNYRVEFQNLVEQALQKELLAEDEEPIVYVSQLAIVDFDFSEEVNTFLEQVAQKQFEKQQAEQDIRIAEQQQMAILIRAQTTYSQTVRLADGEREKRIREAEGQGKAQERLADAQAYETFVTYQAEADGVSLVQAALAKAPEAYLNYLRTRQWDGSLPNWWMGGGQMPVPFIEIKPPEK